jgi:type I restriction enzyme, S subunit
MTEGPYKLPEGWRWVRLGEVCKPTERRDPTKEPESTFQYVDISSVDNTTGEIIGAKELLGKEAPSRARKVIRSNDVIFATTRPYLKNIAIVPPELDGQICSTGFCVLRANEATLEPRFLFYVCRSDLVVEQLSQGNMRGASYPAVTDKDVFDSVIPLPPLAEQRRIVARIEELTDRVREARRLRQEAQKDAERLWQSVLAQTFPRPGSDLPEGWRWVRLGEVAWRDSVTLQPNSQPDTVFHYLGMEHVAPGQWDEPTPVELPGAEIKSQVIVYRPGLVLYGKLRPYLNKVVVPSAEGVASTEFIPLAVKEDVLEPQYLGAYLRSPSFVAYATQNTTGSRQPRVRLDALWGAPIPLPPLAEQRRIVAHLEAVQERLKALKEAQAATEAELKRLEQAILEKAFRGEL